MRTVIILIRSNRIWSDQKEEENDENYIGTETIKVFQRIMFVININILEEGGLEDDSSAVVDYRSWFRKY